MGKFMTTSFVQKSIPCLILLHLEHLCWPTSIWINNQAEHSVSVYGTTHLFSKSMTSLYDTSQTPCETPNSFHCPSLHPAWERTELRWKECSLNAWCLSARWDEDEKHSMCQRFSSTCHTPPHPLLLISVDLCHEYYPGVGSRSGEVRESHTPSSSFGSHIFSVTVRGPWTDSRCPSSLTSSHSPNCLAHLWLWFCHLASWQPPVRLHSANNCIWHSSGTTLPFWASRHQTRVSIPVSCLQRGRSSCHKLITQLTAWFLICCHHIQ